MDRNYISAEAWKIFADQYPEAERFLRQASLEGELTHMRKRQASGTLNAWNTARLAELEEWDRTRHVASR